MSNMEEVTVDKVNYTIPCGVEVDITNACKVEEMEIENSSQLGKITEDLDTVDNSSRVISLEDANKKNSDSPESEFIKSGTGDFETEINSVKDIKIEVKETNNSEVQNSFTAVVEHNLVNNIMTKSIEKEEVLMYVASTITESNPCQTLSSKGVEGNHEETMLPEKPNTFVKITTLKTEDMSYALETNDNTVTCSSECTDINGSIVNDIEVYDVPKDSVQFTSLSSHKSLIEQILELNCKGENLMDPHESNINVSSPLTKGKQDIEFTPLMLNNQLDEQLPEKLFETEESDSQNDECLEDEVMILPFGTPDRSNRSNSHRLMSDYIAPKSGLSDSQPFLSASAMAPYASFEDEKSVALTTEMASALAPPDMPLQLAPTILTNATLPVVSIPDLTTLKYSPSKDGIGMVKKQLDYTYINSKNCDESTASNFIDNTVIIKSEIDLRLEQKALSSESATKDKNKAAVSTNGSNGGQNRTPYIQQKSDSSVTRLTKDNIPVEYDEAEFVWEDYLEETGAQAAPPQSFQHVELSTESGFKKGQVVEVGYTSSSSTGDSETYYWLASIVTPCGQLLGLHYIEDSWTEGEEDDEDDDEDEDDDDDDNGSSRRGRQNLIVDLWCDAFSGDMYPLGWCSQNGKVLKPPDDSAKKINDVKELIKKVNTESKTPQVWLFEKKSGTTPIDYIKESTILELQEEMCPIHVWPVCVSRNIGGYLLLKYVGLNEDTESESIWIFYLNYRVHSLGWCKTQEEGDYKYEEPQCVKDAVESEKLQELLDSTLRKTEEFKLPAEVFKGQISICDHLFREGCKLEALHPKLKCSICPATIHKVINNKYFIVEIDNVTKGLPDDKRLRMCCHRDSPNIFPARWCVRSGLRLLPPKGWQKPDFDWRDYLLKTESEPAPERAFNIKIPKHEFERGLKLEAVDPDEPGQLCAATIVRIVEHLMWIHLDTSSKIVYNHVVDIKSFKVFPVGWCESNNYPLKPPRKTNGKKKYNTSQLADKPMTADEYRSAAYIQIVKGEGISWCPKIYFNHRCFSGAFLSKARLAVLPKSVGPGPITLVMKEVLTMLINGAYKSSRVLREIQLEGNPNPNMHQHSLKAKVSQIKHTPPPKWCILAVVSRRHKGKSYRATVEICKSVDQLEEFCRQVCIKLECCPLLIGPISIDGECPENCSQLTKSKYTVCYGKKSLKLKRGRPPGGHTNLENGGKKPGVRGRKRKRGRQPLNKGNHSDSEGNADNESVNGSLGSSGKLDDEVDEILSKDNDDDGDTPVKKRKYQRKILPPTDIKTRGVKLPSYGTVIYEKRSRIPSAKIRDLLETDQPLLEKRPRGRPKIKVENTYSRTDSTTVSSEHHQLNSQLGVPIFKGETALQLTSNPLYWSVQQVVEFIKGTDSAQFARTLREQEIDGQALLMLSLPTVQEYLDYKLGPAVKLCHHVERLKLAFYHQYVGIGTT